uniref:Uncharacterized protein n=1 Tax=Vespula pensylvanica TaxID=30213 RepID=A0A834P4S8_VESPE|nr:hypothetical protein H0235_007459 [Vespula pensylvanica]
MHKTTRKYLSVAEFTQTRPELINLPGRNRIFFQIEEDLFEIFKLGRVNMKMHRTTWRHSDLAEFRRSCPDLINLPVLIKTAVFCPN